VHDTVSTKSPLTTLQGYDMKGKNSPRSCGKSDSLAFRTLAANLSEGERMGGSRGSCVEVDPEAEAEAEVDPCELDLGSSGSTDRGLCRDVVYDKNL
jgi:hypothetical protein